MDAAHARIRYTCTSYSRPYLLRYIRMKTNDITAEGETRMLTRTIAILDRTIPTFRDWLPVARKSSPCWIVFCSFGFFFCIWIRVAQQSQRSQSKVPKFIVLKTLFFVRRRKSRMTLKTGMRNNWQWTHTTIGSRGSFSGGLAVNINNENSS